MADCLSRIRDLGLERMKLWKSAVVGELSGRPIRYEAVEVYQSINSSSRGRTLIPDQVFAACYFPQVRQIALWL
jgi:hypothetical protein